MFGRKKEQESASPGAADSDAKTAAAPARPGAKNRPTPSRREAEAARRRPIIPADRKAAQRQSREKERSARAKHREAMLNGEEWALPPRDRGAQRRFLRDVVDSRWNIGEFLLPIMVIGLPLSLMPARWALSAGYALVYGALFATILDWAILRVRVKALVQEKFGEPLQRGSGWYLFSRAVQIRPGRIPRPLVSRGKRRG